MEFTLKHYQTRAITFAKEHDRACLVMPTGSGKTLVAIHAAMDFLRKHKDHRILFIGPKPAVNVIPKEFDNFPSLKEQAPDFIEKLKLCTFDSFRQKFYKADRGLVQYQDLENTMMIIDEAHRIKNPKSNTFVAIARHCGLAARVLMLTATPITHSYYDLLTLQFLLALRMQKVGNKYRISLMVHKAENDATKATVTDFIHDFENLKWKEKRMMKVFKGLCAPFHVEKRETVYEKLAGKEPYTAVKVENEEDVDFKRQLRNERELFQSQTLVVKTADNQQKFSQKYKRVLKHISDAYHETKRIYVYFPLVKSSITQAVTLSTIKTHLQEGFNGIRRIPPHSIIVFDGVTTPRVRDRQLETINVTRKNDAIVVLAGSVLRESSTLKCFDHVVFFGPENTFSDLMQAIGRTIRQSSHADCFPPNKSYDKVTVSLFHGTMDESRCDTMRKNREIMKDCEEEMQKEKNYKECELLHLHSIRGLELDKVAKFFGLRS